MRPELTVATSLFANDSGRSGIGRFMRSMVTALCAADPAVAWRFFVAHEDLPIFAASVAAGGDRARLIGVASFWNRPAPSLLWHALAFPAAARRSGADVIYLPAGNRRLVPSRGIPTVAVVHDLSSFHVQGKYDPLRMLYIKHFMPWLIRRTARVIAISTSSAVDVETLARFPRQRITIIPNGYDRHVFLPGDPARALAAARLAGAAVPDRFLLYVSRIEHPGKNHVGLLRGFRRLLDRREDFPYDLVLAGGRWNGAEIVEAEIAALGLQQRVHGLGFVPEGALPELYRACRALVFPSLFEGFGLPILEAQASGVPVAAADCSSLPEVVGDGGLLFDPLDPEAIATAMERVALDDELRAALIERGLANAHRFTWEAAATATLKLLREAADESRATHRH